MLGLILWVLLFLVSWPLALLVLVLYPLVWPRVRFRHSQSQIQTLTIRLMTRFAGGCLSLEASQDRKVSV
jgi:hypothetical protein